MNQDTKSGPRPVGVVAGLLHDADDGDRALTDLKAAGFTRVELSQAASDTDASASSPTARADAYDIAQEPATAEDAPTTATSPFFREHDSSASSFVDELVRLGFSKHDAHDLVDGMVKGDALVTADPGADLERAIAILTQYRADVRYAGGVTDSARSERDVAAVPAVATDADGELQLRAERLVVNKHRFQHGEARVRKEIVTEVKSFDVPVSHEELVIERHAVVGEGVVEGTPVGDATIRIPLTEEKVTIDKETIVKEEVEVGTRRVENVEHISETVRHEELRVDTPIMPPQSRP